MILNDEQNDRFFDTMDSLLYYVNGRFQVVEGFTLDYNSQIGDMKTALVARTLWDNVEIIDEFVRDNPQRLPKRHLDIALGWKNALPGMYTVVRYQGGRALMMSEAGVFSVSGVTLELDSEIGQVPAYVDAVLLPFDDVVVYDGFLQVYDAGQTPDEAARIQDDFENLCARGIVSTGEEFIQVASAYLAAEHDKELDALLADVARVASGEQEVLPTGFHRGALAGLDALARETAVGEELRRRLGEELQDPKLMGSLGIDPFDTIEAIELAGALDAALQSDVLARAGAAGISQPEMRDDAQAGPNRGQATGDLERNQVDMLSEQAMNCAIASVLARGVVEIDEAYDQYRAIVSNPIDRDDFRLLARHEATFSDSYFGLWNYGQRDYLTYYTLTPDYLAQTASRGPGWRGLREELEYYEQYKRGLLESRAEVAPKPLSRTLLENTALGELLRDPSVARLRRFLDERIPDGQDDFTFADLAAQEFALTSIESGSMEELYRLAQDLGLEGCCADEEMLARLATNVFNAMPSWENNGWSPKELYEQLTGRRMFYNDDGTLMKVGGDDLCPCGSGRKYRECCGR